MSKRMQEFFERYRPLLQVHVLAFGVLTLAFILCRYVFFWLHEMDEWPYDLWIVGIIALLLVLFTGKKYAPWFNSLGYFAGFWAGVIFHTHGFDPGGGRTDNLWSIWMLVFFGFILAGFIFEVIIKWWKLLRKH